MAKHLTALMIYLQLLPGQNLETEIKAYGFSNTNGDKVESRLIRIGWIFAYMTVVVQDIDVY